MESQVTTDVSDYIAALKRRRKMLAFIMLPIAAVGVSLAVGLPDKYLSSSLIEFSQAEISGELPNRGRQEKNYADRYVSSLTDAVLATDNLKKELKQPGVPAQLKQGDVEDIIGDIKDGTDVQTVRVLGARSGLRAASARSCLPSASRSRAAIRKWRTTWPHGSRRPFSKASRDILRERAQSSAQFYTAEADRYSKQIGTLESKLADFKAKNFGQLPELADVNLNVMDRTERELENIEMQLTNLRQNRIFLTQQLDQARTASPDATLLTQLQSEYARKQAIYDPDHPDLINLRRQIESLQRGGPAMSEHVAARSARSSEGDPFSRLGSGTVPDHPDVKRIQREIDALEARIARGDRADTTLPATPALVSVRAQLNGVDTQIAGLQSRSTELRGKMDQLMKRVESATAGRARVSDPHT